MTSVLFYLFVFAIVFFLQVCAKNTKNVALGKILVLSSFSILLLLIGLRFEVGTDYVGHIETYEGFVGKDFAEIWSGNGDVGSKLIIGGLAVTGNDAKIIFWIYGLLTLYPLYKVNKNSGFKYLAYSTLVFNLTIFPVCLNIMRQGAAMAFILLAFDFARRNGRIYKVLICSLLAICLHTSALLMVPFILVYYFSKMHSKRLYVLTVLLITVISISFLTFLKTIFAEVGFSNYDYQLVVTRSMNLSGGTILYNVVFYLMLFFLLLLFRSGNSKNEKKDVAYMIIMLAGGSMFELVGSATKYLSRVSYYFSIFQVLLIPELLQGIEKRNTRLIAKIICVITLVGLFIFRCYVQGYYEIIPYQSWLFME